jgi:hypothetical protein
LRGRFWGVLECGSLFSCSVTSPPMPPTPTPLSVQREYLPCSVMTTFRSGDCVGDVVRACRLGCMTPGAVSPGALVGVEVLEDGGVAVVAALGLVDLGGVIMPWTLHGERGSGLDRAPLSSISWMRRWTDSCKEREHHENIIIIRLSKNTIATRNLTNTDYQKIRLPPSPWLSFNITHSCRLHSLNLAFIKHPFHTPSPSSLVSIVL